jgi:hypothetical protein
MNAWQAALCTDIYPHLIFDCNSVLLHPTCIIRAWLKHSTHSKSAAMQVSYSTKQY